MRCYRDYTVIETTTTLNIGIVKVSTIKRSQGSKERQREIMLKLENLIDSHERGNKVYDILDFKKRDDGGCSVIM